MLINIHQFTRLVIFTVIFNSLAVYGDSKEDDLNITVGVEEEFFLTDPESNGLLFEPNPEILKSCQENCSPHKIVPELLLCQIESNSKICHTISDVRNSLKETRRILVESAERLGSNLLAISTHPFSRWMDQKITPKERYIRLVEILRDAVMRLLVSGMHVHLGFGDADERIRVMTALREYLPFMLALSCSSPFSEGRNSGIKSYRANIIRTLPRSDMTDAFSSEAEYKQLIADLKKVGAIKQSNELWWDIRPAGSYPTIEIRICDTCSKMEDAVALTALSMSLARNLLRKERAGELPDPVRTEIITEGRWLAQRYGDSARLIDFSKKEVIPIREYAENLIDDLQEDAQALNCSDELNHIFTIIDEGNSASRQLDIYRRKISEGATEEEALNFVVSAMVKESKEGIYTP